MTVPLQRTLLLIRHYDPGHSWLAVDIRILKQLGLLERISHYSYRSGTTAYLEEDEDALVFMRAADNARLDIIETEFDHFEPCFIRRLARFRPNPHTVTICKATR